MKAYTGIGSRETPPEILALMEDLGEALARKGWVLRSGAAEGADTAFETGAKRVPGSKMELYLPWPSFGARSGPHVAPKASPRLWAQAVEIMSQTHPVPEKLTPATKKLHTRNVFQVLGANLSSPSRFVLYWAKVDKKGEPKGGTRTAVMLAKARDIETLNLLDESVRDRVQKILEQE